MTRSVIVTGAGQGLGRAHALALGAAGFDVVVNDIGAAAETVAGEIRDAGGSAVAHACDVADWDAAEGLVRVAVETFGRLDALVNNAGIVRDRMLVGMSEAEWDDVLRVDLKGHFCPLRHAAAHWRERSKAGEQVEARIVNTSSGAGLMGSVGQGNYAAAKAGVVAMTQVAAVELARYGVTVNALAPAARTPMTEAVFAQTMAKPEDGFDAMDPANVSPLVVWLVGADSGFVTGQVFEVEADRVGLCDGWRFGPRREAGRRWRPDELGDVVKDLLAEAVPPTPVYGA
ncbi:SDR family NAD(P)-dependent oxidoreductase [Geodermatophilus sp. DF01-2]|uniref:SDR family oxidoreductase n=1 Tax=Geodermatophilus sp. DF01-2 TaxID=2559610 RepID=UPI0010741398|nr:SDR family oxidoreductase [Geodermatophilus sp. DF01_2]TFV64322.1 SDR family NAD(P)-dependent oxidoreductase [Geodermatophilus sp. DF01_2]